MLMVNGYKFWKFVFISTLFVATIFASEIPAFANKTHTSHEGSAALKLLKAKYQKLGNWKAEFSQEIISLGLGKSGRFSMGEFIFVGPNKFRFSIVSPEKSEFITNGTDAWYIQSHRIASKHGPIVRHFKKASDIELSKYLVFLNGQVEALKNYKALGSVRDDEIELILSPTSINEISSITIIFNQVSPAPSKIIIEDAMQTKTVLKLNKFSRVNEAESAQTEFVPVIPKNAKVEEL
jgi:outer membrane lipoprotein-sorting protein